MLRKNILPLDVYQFDCPEDLLRTASEEIQRLTWTGNVLNSTSRQKLNLVPVFAGLHDWFKGCIEEVRMELELPFERLIITQSWANRTLSGEGHHRHTHPNSYMSGVFYLTTAENGRTFFFRRDQWFEFFLLDADGSADRSIMHAEVPIAGKLLLFPSTLEHCVEAHKSESPRFTVSFNVFPEGRFDFRHDRLRFLNLKVVPFDEASLELPAKGDDQAG